MKKLLYFLLLSLILNNYSFAQVMGNSRYDNQQTLQNISRNHASNAVINNNYEFQVEVNSLININPDDYVVVFNLYQVADNADEANNFVNTRVTQFRQELKNMGIGESDISIDFISCVPRYEIQVEKKLFSKRIMKFHQDLN